MDAHIESLQSASEPIQTIINLGLVKFSEEEKMPSILALNFVEIVHNDAQGASVRFEYRYL